LASVGGTIRPAAPSADAEGRFYRLTRWVQGYAVIVGGAAIAVLVLLGAPFLGARFEIGDARSLPRSSEVRDVALTLADRFPSGGTDPITVLARSDADAAELATWLSEVAAMDGVAGVAVRPDTPHGLSIVDVTPVGSSQGGVARRVVASIRDTRPGFEIEVGGVAAELVDLKGTLTARLPFAGLVVVIATLVLLFLMTGSVVVPITAILMNILSLGASFGALVFIFQEGHLSGLLGFDSVGALDLWMPVLTLIFAFGLSMDYEVFLLSRIKEVYDDSGDNDLAVATGLQRSGRIITAAAFLIIVVFTGFAAGEVLSIKQLGVGLAIAVLVDATIVRTLLVPAVMKLLGEWNWWAPSPMRRLHERFGLHEAPSAVATSGTTIDLQEVDVTDTGDDRALALEPSA
jgi:RND superfamily putative drug exporter